MPHKKKVLVFEPHGDDMGFACGGTIAKFVDRGHEVALVLATGSDKGSFELSADDLRAAATASSTAPPPLFSGGRIA